MTAKRKVLLVDDDVDFLAANRLALEAAGFDVYCAATSAEARQLAAQVQPQVAVLDVMMDQPDEGFALARALKEAPATRGIKLVMLTSLNEVNRRKGLGFAFSDRDRDERFLPMDRFLDKPIRPRKLIAVLRELTGADG